jgi:hypothetical protein
MHLLRRVWKKRSTNQLIVTIPKDAGIKEGDYVEIRRVA